MGWLDRGRVSFEVDVIAAKRAEVFGGGVASKVVTMYGFIGVRIASVMQTSLVRSVTSRTGWSA